MLTLQEASIQQSLTIFRVLLVYYLVESHISLKRFYFFHFIGEETEAQRGKLTCLRAHGDSGRAGMQIHLV